MRVKDAFFAYFLGRKTNEIKGKQWKRKNWTNMGENTVKERGLITNHLIHHRALFQFHLVNLIPIHFIPGILLQTFTFSFNLKSACSTNPSNI